MCASISAWPEAGMLQWYNTVHCIRVPCTAIHPYIHTSAIGMVHHFTHATHEGIQQEKVMLNSPGYRPTSKRDLRVMSCPAGILRPARQPHGHCFDAGDMTICAYSNFGFRWHFKTATTGIWHFAQVQSTARKAWQNPCKGCQSGACQRKPGCGQLASQGAVVVVATQTQAQFT